MDDFFLFTRFSDDLLGRLSGPLTFRLILQPAMAIYYGLRDGLRDAREGQPLYFRSVVTEPARRRALLLEGAKAVGRVLGLAVVMDVAYQLLVFHWVYPFETIVVVLLLAFVPYLLVRGAANRVLRWRKKRSAGIIG